MKHKHIALLVLAILILAALVWAIKHNWSHAPNSAPQERKVMYWHDPMVPGPRFDKPGKSPFMDMQLVPVYADEQSGDEGSVTISPRTLQNLGVRTAKVELGDFPAQLDAVGVVKSDDRRVEVVQSRAAGWVERLEVRAVNDAVKRGQVVAEIYAPDILAAQEELLLAKKSQGDKDNQLLHAARSRLELLGLSTAQIAKLEKTGKATRRIAIHAPANGVVSELNVRQGAAVSPGVPIMTLTDLGSVWIIAEVLENQASWLKRGDTAEIRIAAIPGKTFSGKVDYLYPGVTAASRTLRVRITLSNPNGELKPDMFASVTLHSPEKTKALIVPSEAVIATGKRNVVIVAEGNGKFVPTEIKSGREREGKTEVLDGLKEGQIVVASGQFLIDSESSLRSTVKRLETTEK